MMKIIFCSGSNVSLLYFAFIERSERRITKQDWVRVEVEALTGSRSKTHGFLAIQYVVCRGKEQICSWKLSRHGGCKRCVHEDEALMSCIKHPQITGRVREIWNGYIDPCHGDSEWQILFYIHRFFKSGMKAKTSMLAVSRRRIVDDILYLTLFSFWLYPVVHRSKHKEAMLLN